MSLLPIIYSSILIFSGILVFVVILSYVSFKTKDDSTYITRENSERGDSERPVITQVNVFKIASDKQLKRERDIENYFSSKKVKAAHHETGGENRSVTKKYTEEKISVLYKKKDMFHKNRPRFDKPRFSIVTNLSEHLEINNRNVESEIRSDQSVHFIEAGSIDYLKYYENY